MCGYARRHIRLADLEEFVKLIGLLGAYQFDLFDEALLHFRPAFGGAAHQQIKDLIINDEGKLKTVDATWWYQCEEQDGKLIVDNKLTTFNARNLTSRYWKSGIRHHRAIVLATAIGEGKEVDKKKHSYFVESDTPLLIGAVYRKFENNLYSTAIITRDEHPRFSEFHDKAFPLFLPPDPEFLQLWLSDGPETHPAIAHLLENPSIFNTLKVTEVKTFKDAVAKGETITLAPDEQAA
ncbi:SOS response-associated peptidase family protein [Cellvibrio sp. UBA7671]|uniref:SOS response-associated peptidase family protein n=1 Tax=Cellvibrio sp. UBA7671 TaxID=1946312 RepID=UPI002F3583FC